MSTTRRLDGWMARRLGAVVVIGLLTVYPSSRLSGQVSLSLSAGGRYSTILVHDQIVTPFDVRPALAAALGATAAFNLDHPWTFVLGVDASTSEVNQEDAGGKTPITHVTTVGVTVGLGRPLKSWLSGTAAVGVLKYFPSERLGLFQDGGPAAPYAQIGLGIVPPPIARYGLGFEIRYDIHKFITDALRVEGFTEARVVQRIAIGARWTLGGVR